MCKRVLDEVPEPLADSEIPPEFKKMEKPFGIEEYKFHRIWLPINHSFALYALLYMIPMGILKPSTVIIGSLFGFFTGFGLNVGSHRYWTHRSFKANRKLQVLLMLLHTANFQMLIFHWSRNHRTHHKYSDTDGDPHNAKRGFWFSHMGWVLMPKHPEVEKGLRTVDVSDLARDPVLRFQAKYYWWLVLVFFFMLPMTGLHILQPELSFFHLFAGNLLRFVVTLHFTFSINSLAHIFGNKPYDKYIGATQNRLVSILANGEGFHNFHHTFPWDYSASEFGYSLNSSNVFIHFFAWLGWAYDLKTVSKKHLLQRIKRTGDGSHPLYDKDNEATHKSEVHYDSSTIWGWGDKEMKKEDLEVAETVFRRSATA